MALAAGDRVWLESEGIVAIQGGQLDRDVIWRELLVLLELMEDEVTEPRLRRLLEARA